MSRQDSILFITSNRLGDAVLSTGILRHLVEAHPGAEITIVCGPVAAALFRAVPGLREIIILTKQPYHLHWLNLWWHAVRRRWTVLVDLRNAPITWLIVARRQVRWRRAPSPIHKVLEMSALLDLPIAADPHVWLDQKARDVATELLGGGQQIIALAPAANAAVKQWQHQKFAELAGRLTAVDGPYPGARVAVIAGPGEEAQARPVIEALKPGQAVDLVGKTDALGIAACLRQCALFVGNDSGLMHMAAALGVPTVGIFMLGDTRVFRPWGKCTSYVTPNGIDDAGSLSVGGKTRVGEVSVAAVMTAVATLPPRPPHSEVGAPGDG